MPGYATLGKEAARPKRPDASGLLYSSRSASTASSRRPRADPAPTSHASVSPRAPGPLETPLTPAAQLVRNAMHERQLRFHVERLFAEREEHFERGAVERTEHHERNQLSMDLCMMETVLDMWEHHEHRVDVAREAVCNPENVQTVKGQLQGQLAALADEERALFELRGELLQRDVEREEVADRFRQRLLDERLRLDEELELLERDRMRVVNAPRVSYTTIVNDVARDMAEVITRSNAALMSVADALNGVDVASDRSVSGATGVSM